MPLQRRLVLILVLLLLGAAAGTHPFTTQARPTSLHLTLGNPSGAVADPAQPTNYLIDRPQYALAYQRDAGIPAWVSWHLDSSDIGSVGRGSFVPDTSLPAGWYQVQPGDYSGSGYDRGHMTPSGDRTSTRANNDATFIMSNIIPQAPDNNQGPWASLENYCRSLLGSSELYIISGGAGSLGSIASGQVQIPAYTWKVIVVLPIGDDDASRVSASTRVIGIWMPNVQGIRSTPWQDFRVSVDFIEAQTGFDFLSNVDPAVQAIVEAQVDGSPGGPTPTLLPTLTPTPVTATSTPGTTTPSATAATTTATPGSSGTDVVISQVYGGASSSGALYANDFIELFNRGSGPVALNGWSVQYASASGSSWQKTDLPALTLLPGQYLLVQEASGGTCTSPCSPLPPADAAGSIAMSSSSAKVVLSTSNTTLSGTCPSGPTIRDHIGYGSANCFEGAGAAPTLDATVAALRAGSGCIDSDDNAADFAASTPAPRNTSAPLNLCIQATPTPTLVPSPTLTTTATATATPTATVSTPTPTSTPSTTATAATPTATASTLTPTSTPSATATATATAPTSTPSATATAALTYSAYLPILRR